jgi:hypothetical protein
MGKKGDPTCSACGEKGHKKNSSQCKGKKSQGKRKADEGEGKDVKTKEEKKEVKSDESEVKKEEEDDGEPEEKGKRPSMKESTRTPKKKPREKADDEQVAKWEVGDVLEAEMGLPNDYEGTFHKVRVIDVLEGNTYRCHFLAFGLKDMDVFLESKLHELFKAQPDATYEVGDDVHVKIAHRKVRGKEVDGEESLGGIWVKAKVVSIKKKTGKVRVEYNNCDDGTDKIMVDRGKLRKA